MPAACESRRERRRSIRANAGKRAEPSRAIDRLLGELLDLDPDARAARLDQVEDEASRARLARLLDAAFDPDSPIVPGGAASPELLAEATSALADPEGREIGAYRLLREIDRGGMGVVYLAERADGRFERRVAVKVVRLDAASRDHARFEREQRILAGLVHPGIARLYDGGVTAEGEPYFVLEYVEGVPIDRYCRERDLDLRARLRLLVEVCDAVSAAHRQLVVHRDLKPSNILVDAEGRVKLLDFGIARLLSVEEDEPAPDSGRKRVGERLTLPYASPEQVRGGPVTTASDVYQLGLLTHELVTGEPPYRVAGTSLAEAERTICEAISGSTPIEMRDRSGRRIPRRTDLEAIVRAALAVDPAERTSSAERLGEDLQRWLDARPVRARPWTLGYRFRRFLARHPLASSVATAALVLVVSLTLVFTLRLAAERDATREQAERARRAGEEAEQVIRFLTDTFRVADPLGRDAGAIETGAGEPTARELLDRGAERIAGELEDQPVVRARMLAVMGNLYQQLGLLDLAEPLLEESLRLRREAGDDPRRVAESRALLGQLARHRGDYDRAADLVAEALTGLDESDPARFASVLREAGNVAQARGRFDDALAHRERELALRRLLGDRRGEADAASNLGSTLATLGRTAEAREHQETALGILEGLYGPDHLSLALPLLNLANLESGVGEHERAFDLNTRVLALFERAYDPEHERIVGVLNNLGNNLSRLGRHEEARHSFLDALDRLEASGDEHPRRASILNNLGTIEWRLGRPAEAETYFRRALAIYRESLPPAHPGIATALYNLGEAVFGQGRDHEAERLFLESRDRFVESLGEEHVLVSHPTLYLARLAERRGRLDEAESLYRRAVDLRRSADEIDPESLREAVAAHDDFLRRRGRSASEMVLPSPLTGPRR